MSGLYRTLALFITFLCMDSLLWANLNQHVTEDTITTKNKALIITDYPLDSKATIETDSTTGAHSVVLHRRVPYTLDQVYYVLSDYENFPDYMPHTKKSDVIKQEGEGGSVKWVDYTLRFLMMVRVHYVLKINHIKEIHQASISWQMHSSETFDDIQGYWKLTDLSSDKAPWTGIKYSSLIDPKISIPRPIFNTLTKSSVYDLFDAIENRLKHLHSPP